MSLCRVSAEELLNDQPVGKYQRAHKEKTIELLEGMFDPLSDDNFSCFFSSDLSHQQMRNLMRMRDELRADNLKVAAFLFKSVLTDFYRSLAFDEASHKLLNAYCRQCYDVGCPACDQMEVE